MAREFASFPGLDECSRAAHGTSYLVSMWDFLTSYRSVHSFEHW